MLLTNGRPAALSARDCAVSNAMGWQRACGSAGLGWQPALPATSSAAAIPARIGRMVRGGSGVVCLSLGRLGGHGPDASGDRDQLR
jgi:hypothetical protein